jgi:hypothetical protein
LGKRKHSELGSQLLLLNSENALLLQKRDYRFQRGGNRLRGEKNSDISSISLKITMAAYGGSVCGYEKESES